MSEASRKGGIVGAGLVPGLPHLLASKPAAGWTQLAEATRALGRELRAAGAESLMLVSSQWFSVLGLLVQTRPVLEGTRVDEPWYPYDFGTLDYKLRTDAALTDSWMQQLRSGGFQVRAVDHPHFPMDTGTVVASRLLDPEGELSIAGVSLNLYGDHASVERVGRAAREAAEASGRRVAIVGISALSAQPHRSWIEPSQDRISSPAHEQWNKRVLGLLEAGKFGELQSIRDKFIAETAADAQLRTVSFLHGAADLSRPAAVRAHAPVWGMGAAVISWTSGSTDKLGSSDKENAA